MPRSDLLVFVGLLSLSGCAEPAAPGPSEPSPDVADPGWLATVEARLRDGQHAFRSDGQALLGDVPERRLSARFDANGAVLTSGADSIGVRLHGFGAADIEPVSPTLGDCVPGMFEPSGACVRGLEYSRDGLTEWWHSTPEGFEQGWTVAHAPEWVDSLREQAGLSLDLGVEGATVLLAGQELWLHGEFGEVVEVSNLAAWDATGEPLDAWFEPSEDGFRIRIDDDGAVYPIEIDPLYTTADWSVSGSTGVSPLASSVAGAGDVNGDGYDDVVLGASGYNSSTGRVLVYHGSSSGISTTASTTLDGSAASELFGRGLAGAGDVNGDGYDDVIVGADGYSSSTGRAYIYPGSSSGISTTALTTLTGASSSYYFGYSVDAAGDVNNDGYDDVIVGAYGYSSSTGQVYIYHGSSSGPSTSATTTITGGGTFYSFGASVSRAGDVNNDGYDDVIVGAFNYSASTGRAYVYLGGFSGVVNFASTTLTGEASTDYFGYSVNEAGDVNRDGYDDVIVGAYGNGSYGRAYVYHGAGSGVSSSATARLNGSSFNFAKVVTGAGDVTGDGYDDVIVGCDGASTSTGAAYLYAGSGSGTSTSSLMTLTGEGTLNYFGSAIGPLGDVNADGYDDVVIGAYGYGSSSGRAYVYHGSALGLGPTATATVSGGSEEKLGYSVSDAGDVNNDGFGDVVVGAPGYGNSTGEALIYHGSEAGLSATANTTLTGAATSDYFGHSVSRAGDVNGDGFDDVVIGAYGYSSSDTGAIYVYHGSSSGLSTTASIAVSGATSSSYLGQSVSDAGDVNNDGNDDVIVGAPGYSSSAGRVYVLLGTSSGITSSASTTISSGTSFNYLGGSVSGAGDVNNDG